MLQTLCDSFKFSQKAPGQNAGLSGFVFLILTSLRNTLQHLTTDNYRAPPAHQPLPSLVPQHLAAPKLEREASSVDLKADCIWPRRLVMTGCVLRQRTDHGNSVGTCSKYIIANRLSFEMVGSYGENHEKLYKSPRASSHFIFCFGRMDLHIHNRFVLHTTNILKVDPTWAPEKTKRKSPWLLSRIEHSPMEF